MTTMIFDTHNFVKKLTDEGMPERQAEVLASTQASLLNEQLATKNDLSALEERLAYRLTLRLGSMLVVAVTLVATLVKIL